MGTHARHCGRRARREAHQQELEAKMYAEELKASASRVGGANPRCIVQPRSVAEDMQVRRSVMMFPNCFPSDM